MPRVNDLDHYNDFVNDQPQPGKFASAEYIAIAAGPPLLINAGDLGGTGGDVVYPIGVIQNFNLSQNMAVARIFELGSKRSYMFPGKVIGAVSFGRPYYHGHSLLRLLMAVYGNDFPGVEFNPVFTNGFQNPHTVHIPPGYENLFLNLASDLFTQPHGELIVMKDTDSAYLGAFYLEQCYIPAHTLAVDAQGIIWQEAVQVQYERFVPVRLPTAVTMVPPDRVFDNDNEIAVNVSAGLGGGTGGAGFNVGVTLP